MDVAVKKNLVIIDLSVKSTSPAGSCVLSELVGLSEYYNIHLLSSEIDDTAKPHVNFYRIPLPTMPLVFRYIIFSAMVKWKIGRLERQFNGLEIIQTTQGQFGNTTVSYAHFCHKAYLAKHWKNSTVSGARRISRKLNHLYNARMELKAFRNARKIVVPSKGLRSELIAFYPFCVDKVYVISNPIDTDHFKKSETFDRAALREKLGVNAIDIVIAFAALGDFARKGLLELMRSLKEKGVENSPFKIMVIGGKHEEIAQFKKKSIEMGVENQLIFTGFKKEIRPYLWASDLFSMPSLYETFSLVCAQAATAGLPLLVTQLHGVEEYLIDGKNGWLVERNPSSIAAVLKDIGNHRYDLTKMGHAASESVTRYDHSSFRKKWVALYASLN